MSPQVAKRKSYDHRTDVWSLGWVFYNLITLHFPNVDPYVFVELKPKDVPILGECFETLRDCICSKMIVAEQTQRGSVADVIADKAFDNFYHSAESKAVSWEYQEAIECMSDRILVENHSQLQEKVERVDGKVEKKSQIGNIKELEKKFLNEIRTTREQVQQQIKVFGEELTQKQKQLEEATKELRNEISKRRKLQKTVDLLSKQNKELEQKFDSFQLQMREEIQRHLQQSSSEDSPSKIHSGRSKPTSDKASFTKILDIKK